MSQNRIQFDEHNDLAFKAIRKKSASSFFVTRFLMRLGLSESSVTIIFIVVIVASLFVAYTMTKTPVAPTVYKEDLTSEQKEILPQAVIDQIPSKSK